MQFTPENCELILAGKKTTTRRVIKSDQYADAVGGMVFGVRRDGKYVWEMGKDYAVQPGRGKRAVARIKILEIRRERLRDCTADDCRAEGLEPDESLSPFMQNVDLLDRWEALWNSLHDVPGERMRDNPMVWVLRFEVVKP